MKTKRALLNFLYSILSQFITISLGLLIPRLTMVGYGSEVNGLLSSVTQLLVYLGLFEAGIQAVAMQSLYKPVSNNDKASINHILAAVNQNYKRTGTFYGIALLAISFIYPLIIDIHTISYWSVFLIILFSGLGNVILFFFQAKYRILLQVEGKSYVLANIHTIISILTNIVKICLLWSGQNVTTVVFASFIVSLIQVGYIYHLIKTQYRWIDLKVEPNQSALNQKNSVIIHQIASIVFQNTDVLILTVFCGLKVVSVYSLYKLITSHLSSLLRSVFESFSFILGQTYNTNKPIYTRWIDIVDVYFGGLYGSVYTVAATLFIPFIKIYTSGVNDINYVDNYICVLFILIEFLTHSRFPMLYTVNYAGHYKETLPQTIIESVLNLGVSLIMVHFWGIYGILIGTVTALLYREIDLIFYTNHKLLDRSPLKTVYIHGTVFLLTVFLIFGFHCLNLKVTSIPGLLITGLWAFPLSFGIFLLTLSLLFPKERRFLLEQIKQKNILPRQK